jgi:hypothetical protein
MDARKVALAVACALVAATMAGTLWAMLAGHERDVEGLVSYVEPSSSPKPGPQPVLAPFANYMELPIGVDLSTQGIWVGYGGALRLGLNNTAGSHELHVSSVRVVWLGRAVEKTVGVTAREGEVGDLGLVWLPGPDSAGARPYNVQLNIQVLAGTAWRILGTLTDPWTDFEPGMLNVSEMAEPSDYQVYSNYDRYYDKANDLLLDEEEPGLVDDAVQEAEGQLGGDYTYEKLCAAFDYVSERVEYQREAEGEDVWQAPDATLARDRGDCEDYALLLCDIFDRMGGTPRLYLIEDHAFAAVWIGNRTTNATSAITTYYDADVQLSYIEDDEGLWLVADPLGSAYLGGLPVNAEPANVTRGWDFTSTDVLHSVDITREPGTIDPWQDYRLWAAAQLACDVALVAIAMHILLNPAPRCAACGRDYPPPGAACARCGARLHAACSPAGLCPRCAQPPFR